MSLRLATDSLLESQMAALSLAPSPLTTLPVELICKISSFVTNNKDIFCFLLKTNNEIRNKFTAILAGMSSAKISAILSQLVNFATDLQWTTFFTRLTPGAQFSNSVLHITLLNNRPELLNRIAHVQARFSPIQRLTIRAATVDIGALIPRCAALRGLFLRDYERLSEDKFCQIALPASLEQVSISLHSLKSAGALLEMGPNGINHLFTRCTNLTHFELRDTLESQNPRPTLAAVKWPSTLQRLFLPDCHLSKEELVSLLQSARSLCSLEVRDASVEFLQQDLPSTLEQLMLTDEAAMRQFQKRCTALFALQKCPKFLNALLCKADSEKSLLKRRQILEKMVAIDPSYNSALERLALLHYESADQEIAHKIVLRLSSSDSGALHFLLPLVKKLHHHNPQRALEVAKMVVSYGKDTASFRAYLGDLLSGSDPVQAKEHLEEAVRVSSKQIDAEAYRLCRLSLASLLERDAQGVANDGQRARELRDVRKWN